MKNIKKDNKTHIDKEDLVLEIGKTLLMCQIAEKQITTCIRYVFKKKVTLDDLVIYNSKRRKETLGILIKSLRKQINVPEDLEKLLDSFLRHRNDFVHNLIHSPEFDLDSPDKLAATYKNVRQLYIEARNVVKIFWFQVKDWAINHLGMDKFLFEGSELE